MVECAWIGATKSTMVAYFSDESAKFMQPMRMVMSEGKVTDGGFPFDPAVTVLPSHVGGRHGAVWSRDQGDRSISTIAHFDSGCGRGSGSGSARRRREKLILLNYETYNTMNKPAEEQCSLSQLYNKARYEYYCVQGWKRRSSLRCDSGQGLLVIVPLDISETAT